VSTSFEHGGNIHAAMRATGSGLHRLIDFSASINPLGPSPRALRAMTRSLRLTVHYPDPDCLALRELLAETHALTPEQFLIGNGSTELIHLLPRALGINRALIVGPTFSEYERAILLNDGRVMHVDAHRSDAYRPPMKRAMEELNARQPAIDAVVLCNPNSPTGQWVSREDVLAFARFASRLRVWVVVDETFVEYCEEHSVLPRLPSIPRLLVLRSFTKFYALPALRIGYLVGDYHVIERIKRRQPPWSVGTLSQIAAAASVGDRSYADRSRAFMAMERPRFTEDLASVHGLRVYPAAANFLLVEFSSVRSVKPIVASLRGRGLLIRDCGSFPGLTSQTARIAVRTETENRRLIKALSHLLARGAL
jgi:threonine-phosphate decarboxylase